MATKHEQIMKYIQDLEIGNRISVRQIARKLGVSEGTAYRAIKDAQIQGYVSTVERVGTVRIEKKEKGNIEKLTFDTVVRMVDGHVLGGRAGLSRTLNHFVIGAMELDAMKRYVGANDLMIVGNREAVHSYALKEGAAVLVTGGFDTSEQAKRLADELELPLISTSYDTFTVAAKINRAIYDQMIKKEIVHVSDILIPIAKTQYLKRGDSPERWYALNRKTSHSRFPVVNRERRVVGIVTMKDLIDHPDSETIDDIMTPNPLVVSPSTSVAAAAHRMIWESIECLPVVDGHQRLIGLITRSDVLKALQMIQQQPQMGETVEDLVSAGLTDLSRDDEYVFQFTVTPQMTDYLGSLSYGIMTSMVAMAGRRALNALRRGDLIIENLSVYFLKPVQIDQTVMIYPKILEITRRNGKLDVEMYVEGKLSGKVMLTAGFMDRF